MAKDKKVVLWALVALVFAKGWVFPGWSSSLELLSCLVLIGFMHYFRSETLEERKLQELEGKIDALNAELHDTRNKIGLRKVI